MRISLVLLFAVVSLLLTSAPAVTHHSIAGDYFMDQSSTVEGDLMKVQLRNPHSWVEFTGMDPKTGKMVTWSVEWNGAGRLEKDGITPETLKPGDHVIITGQPGRKAEEHRLHMLVITRPADGWKWDRSARH